MRQEHYNALQYLNRCTFLPGSFEKRFVRTVSTKTVDDPLSVKQERIVDVLAYRYRRQLSGLGYQAPPSMLVRGHRAWRETTSGDTEPTAEEVRNFWIQEPTV